MRKLYIAFVLSLAIVNLYGQKVVVKDANTRQAIQHVYAYSDCKSAMSNKDGLIDLTEFCKDAIITLQHATYIEHVIINTDLPKDSLVEVYLRQDVYDLNEVMVSASKWSEEYKRVPVVIEKISAKEASLFNPQTAADLLNVNSRIFIQKSQLGGGSPMIRGFSANRVLLVVDGIRMNNAIYRGGNLQNALSIDANAVEDVEVVFGPGSVIYGSDALGGVMSYSTFKPEFSKEDKPLFKGNGFVRYSSANNESTASASLKLATKRWASVTSISRSNYRDLRMGSVGHPSYDKKYFVVNDGKKDTVIENHKRNIQVGSGFSQLNLLQKIAFKPNEHWQFNYNIYYSQLSDVPRYDRLIQVNGDEPKYGDWYYGPQKWFMNSFTASHNKKTKIYDQFQMAAAYQDYQESRHKRKLYKSDINEEFEQVNMASLNFDFLKKLSGRNTIYYGLETWYNDVMSHAHDRNIYTGDEEAAATRYPDGAQYFSSAAYITNKFNFSEQWIMNTGLRYTFTSAYTAFEKTFYNFPYDDMRNQNSAISGNLGLVFLPTLTSKLSINYSTGFRSPNIDDLAKVFDSGVGTLMVPNPDLKAEYVHNIDLAYEMRLWKKIHFLVNGFYSFLDNAMIDSDFTFNGQDSIMYQGSMAKVKAITNKDYANIYGAQAVVDWRFYNNFLLKSSATYTKGYDSDGFGVRHVAPFFGATHIVYDNKKWQVDLNLKYNGRIKYDDLAPVERDKTHMYEADVDGNPYSPEWQTLNIAFMYQVNQVIHVSAAIENILDVRYRPYSSGIAAPGRNLIVSIRLTSF
jgi:hemoglobin/transferrin/lactoferrin receptor protein